MDPEPITGSEGSPAYTLEHLENGEWVLRHGASQTVCEWGAACSTRIVMESSAEGVRARTGQPVTWRSVSATSHRTVYHAVPKPSRGTNDHVVLVDAELAETIEGRPHWHPKGDDIAIYQPPDNDDYVRVCRVRASFYGERYMVFTIRGGVATQGLPVGTAVEAAERAERAFAAEAEPQSASGLRRRRA